MHSEICPVCKGEGKYKDKECHGCHGHGWIWVPGYRGGIEEFPIYKDNDTGIAWKFYHPTDTDNDSTFKYYPDSTWKMDLIGALEELKKGKFLTHEKVFGHPLDNNINENS